MKLYYVLNYHDRMITNKLLKYYHFKIFIPRNFSGAAHEMKSHFSKTAYIKIKMYTDA